MSRARIPRSLRLRIAEDGKYRCGYCLTPEWISGAAMEIDHIVPSALGGPSVEDNLWLACSSCNEFKRDTLTSMDSETNVQARIFDPRRQVWSEHFAWTADGTEVIGLTPAGRITVSILRLNRDVLVQARRNWVSAGWHPPPD